MVVCTRSVVLERRPDLPLCGSKRILQLRAGKSGNQDVRDLLCSAGRLQKARDTRSLLQTPTKVASSEGLLKRDRNAIGQAIVGRLHKDDHWVTTGTAGCTLTAATKEYPEDFRKPVNVHRLRQVSRGVSRESGARLDASSQVRAKAISGLIGPRELALLESHYRLAAAEYRSDNVAGLSAAEPGGDRRHRRPRPGNSEGLCSTPERRGSRTNDLVPGGVTDGIICETDYPQGEQLDRETRMYTASDERGDALVENGGGVTRVVLDRISSELCSGEGILGGRDHFDEAFPAHGDGAKRGRKEGEGRATGEAEQRRQTRNPRTANSSRRRTASHLRKSSPRPGSAATPATTGGTTSPHRSHKNHEKKKGGPGFTQRPVADVKQSEADDCRVLRVQRMTPQPLIMGRNGGGTFGGDGRQENGDGGGRMNGRTDALHRGVAITDELRKELLNPLAHRFRLLRGAH